MIHHQNQSNIYSTHHYCDLGHKKLNNFELLVRNSINFPIWKAFQGDCFSVRSGTRWIFASSNGVLPYYLVLDAEINPLMMILQEPQDCRDLLDSTRKIHFDSVRCLTVGFHRFHSFYTPKIGYLFPSHVQLEHHDVKLRLPIPRRPYLVYFNPHNFERSWAILDLGLTSFDHHESLAVSNPGGCARGVLKVSLLLIRYT